MALSDSVYGPFRSRYSALAVFMVHLVTCLIILIVGGLITEGYRSRGSYAAADVFRYIGYLLSLFLAIAFGICLLCLRGGLVFTYFWFIEIPAMIFQLIAWILDAVNAGKLHGSYGDSYGLAVASAILGVFGWLFTLYIAMALFKTRIPLAELCGGARDCCGLSTNNQSVDGQTAVAHHEGAVSDTRPSGKQSV